MTLIPPATRLPTETEVALDDTDRITVSLFGFPNDVSSLSNDDTRAIFEAILRDRFGTAVKLGTARWTVSPAGRTLGYDGTATRAATGKSLRAQYRFVFVRNDVIQVTCGWGTAGKQEQIQAACRSVLATLQFPGQ